MLKIADASFTNGDLMLGGGVQSCNEKFKWYLTKYDDGDKAEVTVLLIFSIRALGQPITSDPCG